LSRDLGKGVFYTPLVRASLSGMVFPKRSLFESSGCVPNSSSQEHWTLTTVFAKWVLDATRVCSPVWTNRKCYCMRAGFNTS